MQRLVAHNERTKMAQRGETEDGLGWGGLVASKAELREERRQAQLEKDAARWRYWRNFWPALCRMEVARFARLDLSTTYVQSPEDMDKVTDAAMRRGSDVGAA